MQLLPHPLQFGTQDPEISETRKNAFDKSINCQLKFADGQDAVPVLQIPYRLPSPTTCRPCLDLNLLTVAQNGHIRPDVAIADSCQRMTHQPIGIFTFRLPAQPPPVTGQPDSEVIRGEIGKSTISASDPIFKQGQKTFAAPQF